MSQTEQARDHAGDAPPPRATPAGTRVDTAHLRAGDVGVVEALSAPPVESAAAEIVQQVRSQAAQLAAHLQRQQAAIDHREAELNARNAAFENQVRSARLWLNERQGELAERQDELDRQEKDVAKREAEVVFQAKPVRTQKSDGYPVASEAADFADRSTELDRRQAELDALAQRLADRLAHAEKVEDTEQVLRTLEKRRENLDRAEKLLSNEQAELERQRQQFAEERATFAEQTQTDRQHLAQEQQRAIAAHDKAGHELKRQSDEMAARQTVLERMRADLARSQQESLEIRLATEELWARLSGTKAPAALTQSLAQIRL
jgi:DNA repair exonuclease SbcCD ATPase subunit